MLIKKKSRMQTVHCGEGFSVPRYVRPQPGGDSFNRVGQGGLESSVCESKAVPSWDCPLGHLPIASPWG